MRGAGVRRVRIGGTSVLDSTKTIPTVNVNICYAQNDSLSDAELISILNKRSDVKHRRPLKIEKLVPTRCKGSEISISDYGHVSRLSFPDGSSAKVIGQSFHDKGSPKDFTLIKFDSQSYAYSYAHVCGSVTFTYTKDTIKPSDLLDSKGLGENGESVGWIIVPSNWINPK